MESIPSSSLRITQKPSNSKNIHQIKVVPPSDDVPYSKVINKWVCDSDEVGFKENRSKKCNDPSQEKKKHKKDVASSFKEVPPKMMKNSELVTIRPSLPKVTILSCICVIFSYSAIIFWSRFIHISLLI